MAGFPGTAARGAPVAAIACAADVLTFAPAAAQDTAGTIDDPCLAITAAPTADAVAERQVATAMPGTSAAPGTPVAGKDHAMIDLDLMSIYMMIPHHESIVALSKAAQPRLVDERLQEIAGAIVSAQEGEIEELRGCREQFYGNAAHRRVSGSVGVPPVVCAMRLVGEWIAAPAPACGASMIPAFSRPWPRAKGPSTMLNARRRLVHLIVAAAGVSSIAVGAVLPSSAQGTIGAVDDPCLSATGTPSAGSASVAGIEMGAPVAASAGDATPLADPAAVDLDLLYIDLMTTHQSGIAAVAQAATTRVQDERLQEIAETIVESRNAETEELQALRGRWFAGREPLAVDTVTMTAMDMATPGASISMAQTIVDYDVSGMLALICDAEDADRAFIDLAMPHNRIAIDLSNAMVAAAGRDEIRAFAERITRDREAEIDALAGVREDLFGSATPEPVGPGA